MQNLQRFLFDAPRRHGLLSGTNMHRHPAAASHRNRLAHSFAVLLVFLACSPAWALPRHENRAIHREIEALEQQWCQAIVTNNVSEMDRLLADDYIGISSNGTIETKAQELAQRRAGTVRVSKLDLTDTRVRVYGDTAVVTSLADLIGTNGTTDISGEYRYTRVYNRRLGDWKIVSFEASRLNDADARAGKIKP